MEIAVGIIIGLVVGLGIGMGLGRSRGIAAGREEGRRETRAALGTAAQELARGRIPDTRPGDPLEDLGKALRRGWAARDAERQTALREALTRVAGFLDRNVRAHLRDRDGDADLLRERMERALGSLEDLEFFLRKAPGETQGADLGRLVQQVSREFAHDQGVAVRLSLAEGPVRAVVNAQTFMDALYLVLHNAGRFGGGGTVDVTVLAEDGRAVVRIRDRGPGFTEEAFQRAFDPFYSTSDDGLGLGLPHARRVLEEMGGRIELANAPTGGAQVEVSFPAA